MRLPNDNRDRPKFQKLARKHFPECSAYKWRFEGMPGRRPPCDCPPWKLAARALENMNG